MSTSNKTPLTNARFSEAQLIGASVLVVLSLALPLIVEGGVAIGVIIGTGTLLSGLGAVLARTRGYTTRLQGRVLLGGTLITVLAGIIGFTTTALVGALFFTTAVILIPIQLALGF